MAQSQGRIAPFLHICLQSGCEATLKRMRRNYTASSYAAAVENARAYMPSIALGTDLIVGFPGETDDEFQTSYEFCERMGFAKMHVFRYSKREGTPAASAPNQIDPHIMASRSKLMRELASRMRYEQAKKLIGQTDRVLVQGVGYGVTSGLFDVHLDKQARLDTLIDVRILSVMKDASLLVERL